MRAAKAAKDLKGICCNLADQLSDLLSNKAETCNMDYLSEEVLPLLLSIAGTLCVNQPAYPKSYTARWLAEQLQLPEDVLAKLQSPAYSEGRVANAQEAAPEVAPEAVKAHRESGFEVKISEAPVSTTSTDQNLPLERQSQGSHVSEQGIAPELKSAAGCQPQPPPGSPGQKGPRRVSLRVPKGDPNGEADQEEKEEKEEDGESAERKKRDSRVLQDGHSLYKRRSQPGKSKTLALRRETLSATKMQAIVLPKPQIVNLLRSVPLLKKLGDEELERVAEISFTRRYEQDQTIIHYGEVEDSLHIVIDGTGMVSVPHRCGQISKGDFMGEESLNRPGTVSSTQVCALGGGITTLSVPRHEFEELGLFKGIHRKSRALPASQDDEDAAEGRSAQGALVPPGHCAVTGHKKIADYPQAEEDTAMIIRAVQSNKVLGEVMCLTDEQCKLFAGAVHLIEVPEKEYVFKTGDKGNAFFIVQTGSLCIYLENGIVVKVKAGDSFGELALLYDEPRTATVEAMSDTKLWVMNQDVFRSVSQAGVQKRLEEFAAMLKTVPALRRAIEDDYFDMLSNVVEENVFVAEEEVTTVGEDTGTFFMIFEGECSMVDPDGTTQVLKKGDWFGEEQLLKNDPSTRRVVTTSESAVVLVLENDSFEIVRNASINGHSMKEESSKFKKHVKKVLAALKGLTGLAAMKHVKGEPVDLTKCEQAGALGEGSFGRVLFLRDRESGKQYALKAMSKEQLRREGQELMVNNERQLMMLFDNPFIVKMYHTYEDANHLYLLLEPALGGELFDVYTDNSLWGNVECARFYVASVALGISYMHTKRVVWRDLKLENCLLDERGYLKLTDLGIGKLVLGKTYTVCGTADYFAPETLRQHGHNRAADWWACGVLLFIMMAGRSPFDAPDVPQIYKNIIKGMSKVEFPKSCPEDCKDVITALCRKKPEDRLTMQKGGLGNLKTAPFFNGFCWDELKSLRMEPPWKPPKVDYDKIARKELTQKVEIDLENLAEWSEWNDKVRAA